MLSQDTHKPRPISRHRRRGFSRIEWLVTIGCVLLLMALAFVVFNGPGRRNALRAKDALHIQGIDQSWLMFAREFDGNLPTPSRMVNLSATGLQTAAPGREDVALNTTANLYSACVMQNYISPETCVGPTEPNPKVTPLATYNYDAYLPAKQMYWDSAFKADLQTGSNVSYAHMPIFGKLRDEHWRESVGGDAAWPILGNRGPLNGVADPKSYTYRIHPPFDQWSGNICFADNHVEFLLGLPSASSAAGRVVNTQGIFRHDGEDDADGILTFTKAMSVGGPVIQHD